MYLDYLQIWVNSDIELPKKRRGRPPANPKVGNYSVTYSHFGPPRSAHACPIVLPGCDLSPR